MEQAPDSDPHYDRLERAKTFGSFAVCTLSAGLLTAAGVGIAEQQADNAVVASLVVDTGAVLFTVGAVTEWNRWQALRAERREQQ